jgi:hypothetical protein
MTQLNGLRLYAILLNLQYFKEGAIRGVSPMKSFIITGNSNVSLIAVNIHNALNRAYSEYGMDAEESIVSIF